MMEVSRAERKAVLDLLSTLPKSGRVTDPQLFQEISIWIQKYKDTSGFGYGLQTNLLFLCDFLRRNPEHSCAGTARRALSYIALNDDVVPDDTPHVGLIDDAFVASYAVHEIRCALGENASLLLPQLTKEERKASEDLFAYLMEKSRLPEDLLVSKAKALAADTMGRGTFWNRLSLDVDMLSQVVSTSADSSAKAIAKAALEYLLQENDVIDDSLSLVGHLDDFFILELAVQLTGLTKSSWDGLIRENILKWPFLGEIAFSNAEFSICPPSEYLLVNLGLSLLALEESAGPKKLGIALPVSGPLPTILGFVAGLALTRQKALSAGSRPSFKTGDKVLVDGKAVGIFEGYLIESGKEFFVIRQDRRAPIPGLRTGGSSRLTKHIPVSEIYRLSLAPTSRQTRGRITSRLDENAIPVTALEKLLHLPTPIRNFEGIPALYVVTPVGEAHDVVRSLSLYGELLSEIVPMGSVGRENDEICWSTRFGKQAPIIRFAPDLDSACEAMEESGTERSYVIADISGNNASKAASLIRIGKEATGSVILTRPSDSDSLDLLTRESYLVWEWNAEDLAELSWPPSRNITVIGQHEERMRRIGKTKVSVTRLSSPEIDLLVRTGKSIAHLVRKYGKEGQVGSDEILRIVYGWTAQILRLAAKPSSELIERMEQDISRLWSQVQNNVFFSQEEQKETGAFGEALRNAMKLLCANNPKAEALKKTMLDYNEISIVCRGGKEASNYVDALGRPALESSDLNRVYGQGAVFLGWYGHTRMAPWLYPPLTSPLILLLYEAEAPWYRCSTRNQAKALAERRPGEARKRLYPGLGNQQASAEITIENRQSLAQENDDLVENEAHAQWRYINTRARSTDDEPEVAAR